MSPTMEQLINDLEVSEYCECNSCHDLGCPDCRCFCSMDCIDSDLTPDHKFTGVPYYEQN